MLGATPSRTNQVALPGAFFFGTAAARRLECLKSETVFREELLAAVVFPGCIAKFIL